MYFPGTSSNHLPLRFRYSVRPISKWLVTVPDLYKDGPLGVQERGRQRIPRACVVLGVFHLLVPAWCFRKAFSLVLLIICVHVPGCAHAHVDGSKGWYTAVLLLWSPEVNLRVVP